MFERSEFGHRPLCGEERREPMRLHRIGERPAQMVLVTFCQNKSDSSFRAKALDVACLRDETMGIASLNPPYGSCIDGVATQINNNSFRPEGRVHFFC